MKRIERLNLITQIITKNTISTQEDLKQMLESQGINITQATLSRDMRELGIVKKREHGSSFYSFLSLDAERKLSHLQLYFSRFVVSVASSSVMVVIHTHLGDADLLANAFDAEEERTDILGTLAGADTLFITCASEEAAQALVSEIEDAL